MGDTDTDDHSYEAEYAKTNRSSCKSCKARIPKGSLRLASVVQSVKFDGKMPLWFHFDCFWKRARPESVDVISGFGALHSEDQQKIQEKISCKGGTAVGVDTAESGRGSTDYGEFSAEYAKSGASTCRKCLKTISKGEIRLSRKEYESSRAQLVGGVPGWHHVKCFAEQREEIGFRKSMLPSRIPGFSSLTPEDQRTVEELLCGGQPVRSGARSNERSKGRSVAAGKRKADQETLEAPERGKTKMARAAGNSSYLPRKKT